MTPEQLKKALALTAESAKTGKPHQGGGIKTALKKIAPPKP